MERVHQDRGRWALVALGSALLFVLVGLSARTSVGFHVDDSLTRAVLIYVPEPLRQALDHVARPWVIVVLAPTAVLLALLAVVRRGWRRLAAACCITSVPVVLALELPVRQLLGLPSDGYPSDHAAAALGLVVAVVVLWPSSVGPRELVVAAAVALCVAVGNVSWYAHHMVDVLGSALLVSTAVGLALTVVGTAAMNLEPSARG
jgi:membrane-associated phospholipid phosphatase